MATKSEINLFINNENNKAIMAITNKYNKMIEDRRTELLEERGFAARAKALQRKINELHTLVSALELDIRDDAVLSIPLYSMLANKMSDFVGQSGYLERIANNANYDRTNVSLMKDEWRKTREETNINYNNLREATKKMDAKKSMAYLKEMGFDITPLQNNTTETALLALVDKTKLFYPRKTEEASESQEGAE